ncbi:hypothetical protein, partial [Vibrio jasicida]|uniref:hypothetical protein n=1 Tax=Vibrio jasicida TaxID=766224 RepID=UPI001CA5EBE2
MNYILLIPNLDSRAPNKVAVEIFKNLSSRCLEKKIYYTGKEFDSSNFLDATPKKLSYRIFKSFSSDCIIHSHGFIPDLLNICSCLFKKNNQIRITTVHSLILEDLKDSKNTIIANLIAFVWFKVLS